MVTQTVLAKLPSPSAHPMQIQVWKMNALLRARSHPHLGLVERQHWWLHILSCAIIAVTFSYLGLLWLQSKSTGEELLGRKSRTALAGIMTEWMTHSLLSVHCACASFWTTGRHSELPSWSSQLPPEVAGRIIWHYWELFQKENGKSVYLQSCSACIYIIEKLELVWIRKRHCAYLTYWRLPMFLRPQEGVLNKLWTPLPWTLWCF